MYCCPTQNQKGTKRLDAIARSKINSPRPNKPKLGCDSENTVLNLARTASCHGVLGITCAQNNNVFVIQAKNRLYGVSLQGDANNTTRHPVQQNHSMERWQGRTKTLVPFCLDSGDEEKQTEQNSQVGHGKCRMWWVNISSTKVQCPDPVRHCPPCPHVLLNFGVFPPDSCFRFALQASAPQNDSR